MNIEFVSLGIWPRLRQLARTPGRRAYVAVPFVGAGATKRLPLRRGDILITKVDQASVRAGQVDPKEIATWIRRGVEVHSVANLHAKVYVFGHSAFVGSANVSASSEEFLIEAGCQTANRNVVRKCRNFIESLRGEIVELKFAQMLIPLWRPPITPYGAKGRASHRVRQSELVAVQLQEIDYDDVDESAADRAQSSAIRKVKDRERFRLEDFRWTGRVPSALRVGSRVLMCTGGDGHTTNITAPGRILEIRRYRSSRGAARAIVVVELRKHLRERRKSEVLKALGPVGKPLRTLRGVKPLRDGALIYRLGQLWPTIAES